MLLTRPERPKSLPKQKKGSPERHPRKGPPLGNPWFCWKNQPFSLDIKAITSQWLVPKKKSVLKCKKDTGNDKICFPLQPRLFSWLSTTFHSHHPPRSFSGSFLKAKSTLSFDCSSRCLPGASKRQILPRIPGYDVCYTGQPSENTFAFSISNSCLNPNQHLLNFLQFFL